MFAIPDFFLPYINSAAQILKDAGCKECYIFGSIAQGCSTEKSDIDIAIRGLPPEKFFNVYGKIGRQVPVEIDLVDLDDGSRFSKKLETREEMIRVF
jgi:predicted nucleotidyltransferase